MMEQREGGRHATLERLGAYAKFTASLFSLIAWYLLFCNGIYLALIIVASIFYAAAGVSMYRYTTTELLPEPFRLRDGRGKRVEQGKQESHGVPTFYDSLG